MIVVALPAHLRTLAQVQGAVSLDVPEPATPGAVLDALEAAYPMLRGTIRDRATGERRPFIRFFVLDEDWSDAPPDTLLPPALCAGRQPFRVVGAMAGG